MSSKAVLQGPLRLGGLGRMPQALVCSDLSGQPDFLFRREFQGLRKQGQACDEVNFAEGFLTGWRLDDQRIASGSSRLERYPKGPTRNLHFQPCRPSCRRPSSLGEGLPRQPPMRRVKDWAFLSEKDFRNTVAKLQHTF